MKRVRERIGTDGRPAAMKVILAVLLAGLLVACARFAPGAGPSSTPQPSDGAPDLNGAWVLHRGHGPQGDIEVPGDYRVTLQFTDDEVAGLACNHYGGRYDLRPDGSITFSAMAMTEMACSEPMMTVEAAYHAALAAVTHVARDGDTLSLSGDGTELVFTLLTPVPDAALQGTRWTLGSLIHGDVVSSVLGDAWLVLEPDGTMRGSTGCRDLSGSYVVTGDQLTWTDLRADGECGKQLAQQDRHVIEVLERPIVAIEGNHLTLTLPDGTGLEYLAAER